MTTTATSNARRIRFVVGSVLAAAIAAPVTWAFASFFASGGSTPVASVDSLNRPAVPALSRLARNVVVAYAPATSVDGVAATSYTVTRRPTGNGSPTPVTCVVLAAFQCTDVNVPTGAYEYAVTANYASWTSQPSPVATINVPAPTFTIAPAQTVKGGAQILGGSYSDFQAGDTITVKDAPGGFTLGSITASATGSGSIPLTAGTTSGTFAPVATSAPGVLSALSANSFTVDAMAPITTATITGTLGNAGWYTSLPTVTLAADEAVQRIDYSTAGTAAPTTLYTGPFGLVDGTTVLTFRSTDSVGNLEATQTRTVKVDVRAPQPGTLGAIPPYLQNPTPIPLFVVGSDDTGGSGVEKVTYDYCTGACASRTTIATSTTVQGGYLISWTPPANNTSYTVRATVFDVAGNSSISSTQSVTIDNTAPTASITAPTGSPTVAGTSALTATASDTGGSGVASVRFDYRQVGVTSYTSLPTDTTAPYGVSLVTTSLTNGNYEARIVVTDNAGNTRTVGPNTFAISNLVVSTFVTADGAGSQTGELGSGDTVSMTFNKTPNVNSICSSWTTAGTNQTATGTITVTEGTNDSIAVAMTSGCGTLNLGTLVFDDGGAVSGGNAVFPAQLTWTASSGTLRISVTGAKSSGTGTVRRLNAGQSATLTFTPSASITAGSPAVGINTAAVSATGRLF